MGSIKVRKTYLGLKGCTPDYMGLLSHRVSGNDVTDDRGTKNNSDTFTFTTQRHSLKITLWEANKIYNLQCETHNIGMIKQLVEKTSKKGLKKCMLLPVRRRLKSTQISRKKFVIFNFNFKNDCNQQNWTKNFFFFAFSSFAIEVEKINLKIWSRV